MLSLDYFRRTFDSYYTGWDFAILPFILIAVWLYGRARQNKKIDQNSAYSYYTKALMIKVIGAVLFCLGYTIVLRGGDTSLYFWSSNSCANLAFTDFGAYWQILKGNINAETLSAFNSETGYVAYMNDMRAFTIVRLTSIISLISFRSYLITAIVLNLVLFNAFWKFFKLLHSIYPHLIKPLFWGIFLIPSVVFWGSGILKDSYTMAATLWFAYSFYYIAIKFDKSKLISCIIYAVISISIFLNIKPYILFALIIGLAIWFVFGYIQKIKNPFFRAFTLPILLLIAIVGAGAALMKATESSGGFYSSPEAMMERAVIIQNDLTQDYYGTNSFDIGSFDASYTGILSKAPVAIVAGLFRPFIWEANGPTLLMSALENIFIMVLLIIAVFGRGIKNFFKQLSSNHYLIFSFTFTLILSLMVGLTTANFGALVRYKIPYMPFLITSLLIIYNNQKIIKNEKGVKVSTYQNNNE
ncbi:MAG TPA: hypothetical protein PLO05_07820 [Bacteroidales bacterium]|nr:hypothetical protein [Bacteroidales bacterium]HXK82047.1 hypothetical protein [Bacteroidales bacterium]